MLFFIIQYLLLYALTDLPPVPVLHISLWNTTGRLRARFRLCCMGRSGGSRCVNVFVFVDKQVTRTQLFVLSVALNLYMVLEFGI